MTTTTTRWAIPLAILYVLMIVVNILANLLPLNGKLTGEISDQFPIFFVPAGYVFSIWFIIYVGLLALLVYYWKHAANHTTLQQLAPWLVVNFLCNSLWIFMWHYELFGPSVLVMLGVLVSLIGSYRLINRQVYPVCTAYYWFVQVPLSIYLGWISVATIANVSVWLYVSQWSALGLSGELWAALLVAVAVMLAVGLLAGHHDVMFVLTIMWALLGIAVKFSTTAYLFPTIIMALVILSFSLVVHLMRIQHKVPSLSLMK